MIRTLGSVIASIALLTAMPAAAASAPQPSSASRLSIADNAGRVGAPVSTRSSKLGGGTGGLVAAALGIGILAIVVLAVLDETDDDDDSFPVSP